MVGGHSEERWRCVALCCEEAETGTKVRHDVSVRPGLPRRDGAKGSDLFRQEKNPQ